MIGPDLTAAPPSSHLWADVASERRASRSEIPSPVPQTRVGDQGCAAGESVIGPRPYDAARVALARSSLRGGAVRRQLSALLRPRPGGDHRRAGGADRLRAPAGANRLASVSGVPGQDPVPAMMGAPLSLPFVTRVFYQDGFHRLPVCQVGTGCDTPGQSVCSSITSA
jgi:hypothetical protein